MNDEDPTVRRLERQLAREGVEPRVYAASILRLQPPRWLLLMDGSKLLEMKDRPEPFELYTALWDTNSPADFAERWRPVFAAPVATLEDLHGALVNDLTGSQVLWDLTAKRVTWSFQARLGQSGFRCDRAREGLARPAARPGAWNPGGLLPGIRRGAGVRSSTPVTSTPTTAASESRVAM